MGQVPGYIWEGQNGIDGIWNPPATVYIYETVRQHAKHKNDPSRVEFLAMLIKIKNENCGKRDKSD